MTNYNSKILFIKREKQRSVAQLVCNMSGYNNFAPGKLRSIQYAAVFNIVNYVMKGLYLRFFHDILLTISLLVTRSYFHSTKLRN